LKKKKKNQIGREGGREGESNIKIQREKQSSRRINGEKDNQTN